MYKWGNKKNQVNKPMRQPILIITLLLSIAISN